MGVPRAEVLGEAPAQEARLTVSLLVPLGEGHNEQRETHWEWLRARWEALRPSWEVVEGRCRADRWCKATAVDNAARQANGDVWVICDADLWVESWPTLKEAAELARATAWVVPCGNVYRLDQQTTAGIVAHDPDRPVDWPTRNTVLARVPYRLIPAGGIFAVTPDNYRASGGFDPRFIGYGGEDTSLACALNTLVGEPARLDASVWHLAHPLTGVAKLGRPSGGNDRMARRYLRCEGDPIAMRELIDSREG